MTTSADKPTTFLGRLSSPYLWPVEKTILLVGAIAAVATFIERTLSS